MTRRSFIANAFASKMLLQGGSGLRRELVVLGSSTAAGTGARSSSESWVGQLEQSLGRFGIKVSNWSVPGSNLRDLSTRHTELIREYRPQVVLQASSLVNEGFHVANPDYIAQRYLGDLMRMVSDAQANGIRTIVAGQLPCVHYRDEHDLLIQKLTSVLAARQLLFWNFYSGLVDPTNPGRWRNGYSSDGVHPENLVHRLIAQSIVLGPILQAFMTEQASEPDLTRYRVVNDTPVSPNSIRSFVVEPVVPLARCCVMIRLARLNTYSQDDAPFAMRINDWVVNVTIASGIAYLRPAGLPEILLTMNEWSDRFALSIDLMPVERKMAVQFNNSVSEIDMSSLPMDFVEVRNVTIECEDRFISRELGIIFMVTRTSRSDADFIISNPDALSEAVGLEVAAIRGSVSPDVFQIRGNGIGTLTLS